MRLAACALLCSVLVLGTAREARAAEDPTSEAAVERAREAYRLGIALAKQGQWADALAQLERSYELHAHPTTIYNIGYCQRALARYTRARRDFLRALAAHDAPDGQGLTPAQLQQTRAFLREIDTRLARAIVSVVRPDTTLAVDGRPLELVMGALGGLTMIAGTRELGAGEVAPAASFTVVLDPGQHVFSLGHADGRSRAIAVTLEPGESRAFELDVGDPSPAGEASEPAPKHLGDLWLPGWLALGLGGAGLVTAAVSGGVALDAKADLDERCPTPQTCPPESENDIDRLTRASHIASVATAVGIAGAALGTTLLVLHDPDEANLALRLHPCGAAVAMAF